MDQGTMTHDYGKTMYFSKLSESPHLPLPTVGYFEKKTAIIQFSARLLFNIFLKNIYACKFSKGYLSCFGDINFGLFFLISSHCALPHSKIYQCSSISIPRQEDSFSMMVSN